MTSKKVAVKAKTGDTSDKSEALPAAERIGVQTRAMTRRAAAAQAEADQAKALAATKKSNLTAYLNELNWESARLDKTFERCKVQHSVHERMLQALDDESCPVRKAFEAFQLDFPLEEAQQQYEDGKKEVAFLFQLAPNVEITDDMLHAKVDHREKVCKIEAGFVKKMVKYRDDFKTARAQHETLEASIGGRNGVSAAITCPKMGNRLSHPPPPPPRNLDSIPADALNHILEFLDLPDRLNLRVVCSALERTIAQTTFHNFRPGTRELDDLEIGSPRQHAHQISIRFGSIAVKNFDPFRTEELLHFLQRLFEKGRVNCVSLFLLNFNIYHTSYIESILKNITYKSITIAVDSHGFHPRLTEYIHKYREKISHIAASECLLNKRELRLPPLLSMMSFESKKSKPQKLNDDAFLSLLKERHSQYVLKTACQSEVTLLKAILTINDSRVSQDVEFEIESAVLPRFFHLIGCQFLHDIGFVTLDNDDFSVDNPRDGADQWTHTTIVQHHGTVAVFVAPQPAAPFLAGVRISNRQPPRLKHPDWPPLHLYPTQWKRFRILEGKYWIDHNTVLIG